MARTGPGLGWVLLLAGCAGHIPLDTERQVREAVPFLVEGTTAREELLLKFGPPAGSYEGERILSWRLTREREGEFRPFASDTRRGGPLLLYALTAVFDDRGILARFSLVPLQ